MSTANFLQRDECAIFSLTNIDDSESNNDYIVEDTISNIEGSINKKLGDNINYSVGGSATFMQNMSYPGRSFLTVYINDDLYINCIATSAYYEGVNFGYIIEGVATSKKDKMLLGNAIEEIERVYGEYTTVLNCVGRFSNGEALYSRANKIK